MARSSVQRVTRRSREDIMSAAEGLLTQTPGNMAFASSAIPVTGVSDGTVSFTMIGCYAGETVTNLVAAMMVNGSGQTLVKMGLYTTAGVLLAATADVKATFASGATKLCVCPLVTPYVVPADSAFYVALLSVGGTGPTLERFGGIADALAASGKARRAGRQATQSDLPSPATIVAGGNSFWFGVS